MAITLTTSYQKIAETTIGTASNITFKIRLYGRYTSQSTSGNSTAVQIQLRHYVPSGYIKYYSSSQKITGSITASGSNATNKQFDAGEATLLTKSATITHNQDGTKSISVGASFTNSYFGNTVTISNTSVTLPKINRLATITSASDFTDEGNPTLSFNNPAGFIVYPYLNFYDDAGTKVYGLSRSSSSATSPYTWNLTDAERTALRKATNKQQTYKVSVGVDTYNGTTKLGYNSVSKIMSYVNAEPTATHTFVETNQKVIDLLGTNNANTLIQNISRPKLTVTPTAKKEATMSKVLFSYDSVVTTITASPYEKTFELTSPTITDFYYRLYDSRNFSPERTTISKNVIAYIPVEVMKPDVKRLNPTSSTLVVNAQIKYKQTSFGSKTNSVSIEWALNKNGPWTALSSTQYTIDSASNLIKINELQLENILSYETEGTVYLRATDLLSNSSNEDTVTRGIPTCDMGEHDFNVNGELYISDQNGQNKKEIRELMKDLLHPVGSFFVTSTNTNPSSYLGGTWELTDKALRYTSTEASTFTMNSTNVSSVACALMAVDHVLRCRIKWQNKVKYADDTYELGTITPRSVGLTGWPYGLFSFHGGSDGANSVFLANITDQGIVSVVDTISKTSGTASATEQPCYIDFTIPVKWTYMVDEFCDRFYWKRTA